MEVTIHLGFNGQCEAAFREYERLFGGKITLLVRYAEAAGLPMPSPEWGAKVLHASLELSGQQLSGSDYYPDAYRVPQGFSVTMTVPELAQAKRLFEALAVQGTVHMALQPTFWSTGFGVVTDRFGTPWEINCGEAPARSDA